MSAGPHPPRGVPSRPARWQRAAALVALVGLLAGCGDFSTRAAPFSAQPSLTAPAATPVVPTPSASSSSTPSSSGSSRSTAPPDPCRPPDPAVVAACLAAPWGLVPLADGNSALVGERTTGRILLVARGQKPVVITTVAGLDHTGDGGLLGLAVSRSYAEDGLIYAYVTTATDNRILRLAPRDGPKPVFTGIPKGRTHNGGVIGFAGSYLYVATGDVGRPALAGNSRSLAGKVLRLDEFGRPAGVSGPGGGPTSPGRSGQSPQPAVWASGFTAPTGMCLLPTGVLAVLDHRPVADLLLGIGKGASYLAPKPGDATWTWTAASGGAADCAYAGTTLANTSLAGRSLMGVPMTALGSFTGAPEKLLARYGRLLTVEAGPRNVFWVTTSNRDGHGSPVAADDRVVVVTSSGGAGGGPE